MINYSIPQWDASDYWRSFESLNVIVTMLTLSRKAAGLGIFVLDDHNQRKAENFH